MYVMHDTLAGKLALFHTLLPCRVARQVKKFMLMLMCTAHLARNSLFLSLQMTFEIYEFLQS